MGLPPAAFYGDREYFQVQKRATTDALYIGTPLAGRYGGRVTVPFARRLTDLDGAFSGVVWVSVPPSHFTASYNMATFGEFGFLGMIGTDTIVRAARAGSSARLFATDGIATPIRFPLPANGDLLDGAQWFADKRDRYVGWSAVAGYPLVAVVGLDRQEILAPYFERRAETLSEATIVTAILFAFTLGGMALAARLAWRKHQMEQAQATYRIATESGRDGFYIAHPLHDPGGRIEDFEVSDCNQRGAELFDLRREELIGRRVSTLHRGAMREECFEMLRKAVDIGAYEAEFEEEPTHGHQSSRWLRMRAVRSENDLAVTLSDISAARAHVAELERRSNHDALTGLPNRQWVTENLPTLIEEASAAGSAMALLFIDLDGFKTVNDTMGHAAGDEVLRSVACRLKDAVRPHDCVVRLGGDEFVVIVENIAHSLDAAHVAERILHAFQDSFRLTKGAHSVGVSIGIAMFPGDGTDAETLLHHADVAMYSVKTGGKRHYRFFDREFHDQMLERHDREAELRRAIDQDELVMVYQPRVEISTGTTSSMEALVRWNHPARGLISPTEFIPLAEETGLIVRLGEMVIDKVCAQLADWKRRSRELVPVSINVSPRQFDETDVGRTLASALARHHIDPSLIELELTESTMMGEGVEVAQALRALQRMGVRLLVDDFGTGYSSLSQLQRLDFDVLKVDRAFTADLQKSHEGNVFYKAIITMAHALEMKVVAEGVENLEQIQILKSLKCDEIQGFYISKPLPATETQPVLPKWFFPSTA
jgi:diguanylate cyclase (GGDEF)-like protein